MNDLFNVGDVKYVEHQVCKEDFASFNGKVVHEVYSTYALGREAEWACRQFVLEMKESHEEGVGTFLNIQHISPAKLGEQVVFEATIIKLSGNEIICSYIAKVGDRLIATGEQGQKILEKTRIQKLFYNVG
jgi:predicted thioesterase